MLPSPFFCSSQHDPCSCTGGGFQIFQPLCDAASNSSASSGSNVSSNQSLAFVRQAALNEYPGLLDSLEGNVIAVVVSFVVIVVIALVFGIARSSMLAARAEREKDEAEVQRLELLEMNKKIQKELSLNSLNHEQSELVHAGAAALEAVVPARYKIRKFRAHSERES